ncbi:unnamed protein product [Urochloa decumbens]|uniref:Uncharacterized protein n=1 Tax=Urochloa decumbens TaxID=240449 RepID=A0ABC9G7G1_9POAL
MRKAKRHHDDLTRSSRKNRRVCKNELVSGRFLAESNQNAWTGLSDELKSYLSKRVASITLHNGDTLLFSCSGIAMERQGCHLTRFLTSANLVKALDSTNKDHDDLMIQVRHEGDEVYDGFVAEIDMDHNFADVDVHAFLDVQVGPFQCALEIPEQGEVLTIGRGVSGEIMAKSVELNVDSRVFEDDDLGCKISEAWEGGPLVSDRNIVGMKLFLTMRRAILPWGTIVKHLEHYWASRQKKTGLARSKNVNIYRFGARSTREKSDSHTEVHGDFLNQEQLELDSMGYPKLPPTVLEDGMILDYSFEETFGDEHGKGVWRKISKRANINGNVVALASFNGEKRFFACTGFFIEWNGSTIILTSASLVRNSGDENKIVENLRIEVLLDNKIEEGTLKHWDLHYNVALVTVKNNPALRPLNTLVYFDKCSEVAAVGRCFKSRVLMATSGDLVSWSGTLDCAFLARSTCKIKKAGIGGPLVNLDGDVIGMNFYDKRIGTPFLFWADICEILASFKTDRLGEVGNDIHRSGAPWKMPGDDKIKLNRWPVPMPRWCWEDEDKSDDDDELGSGSDSDLEYNYVNGEKLEFY